MTPAEFKQELGVWLASCEFGVARWDQRDPSGAEWVAVSEIPDVGPHEQLHVIPKSGATPTQAAISRFGHGILLQYPRFSGRALIQVFVGIKPLNESQLELVQPYRALVRRLRKRASIPSVMWFQGIGEYRPKGFKCSEGAMAWVREGGELRDFEKSLDLTIPLPLHEEHGGDDAGPPPSVVV